MDPSLPVRLQDVFHVLISQPCPSVSVNWTSEAPIRVTTPLLASRLVPMARLRVTGSRRWREAEMVAQVPSYVSEGGR